jgi:filamentous hemagglutinin family protein
MTRRGGLLSRFGGRKAVAFLALLAFVENAAAANILKGSAAAATPTRSATAAANQAAAQGAAAASRIENPLRQALDAIRTFQASQDAARGAAAAGPVSVPNGLGAGGLDPATGGTWLEASQPTESSKDGRTEVAVTQTAPRAILTWNTFNVGRETNLVFDQSAGRKDASGWVVLNRVLDPLGRPSTILGTIKAPGQVYVLNRNGILFGGTAQVNVGSLLLSGLEIAGSSEAAANQRFQESALAGLSFERPTWGQEATGDLAHAVVVEAGARITAAPGGRVVLLGGNVRNAGTLDSPDGQVFLAAGKQVQLLAPTPSDLGAVRGLAPPDESVDPLRAFRSPLVELDGAVENTGILSARRGNILMLGSEARQNGLATATTGAEAEGSIYVGQVGLHTSLGKGSVTQVLPETDETARLLGAGETYRPSRIKVAGNQVEILDNATIYAPAGDVSVRGYMTGPKPTSPDASVLELDETRVYVAPGARIDVSGLRGVEVAMEQNSIKAELRANELRDNPLLREGPLRSKTVHFDARLGGKLRDGTGVADLSGYYDLVEHKVTEFMTAGGTVTANANWIVAREGSLIDVSGGSLLYLPGSVRRTVLITETGARVPIEDAVKGVKYVGTDEDFVVSHLRWGITETWSKGLGRPRPAFEPGYLQGSNAGTLSLGVEQTAWNTAERLPEGSEPRPVNPSATAAVRVLDGSVASETVTGPRQREANTGSTDPTRTWRERPRGGSLALTGAGDVSIDHVGPLLPADFGATSVVDPSLHFVHVLPAAWFDGGGFASVSIASGYDSNETSLFTGTANRAPGGHLSVGEGVVVDLGSSGSFSWSGKSARIDGVLRAPGGSVGLTALDRGGPEPRASTIQLGPNGEIDVAGRWTNESLDGLDRPLWPLKGGNASLTAQSIDLEPGSRIDVSGGGRLSPSGSKLTPGDGGSIALDVSRLPRPSGTASGEIAAAPAEGSLVLGGDLEGTALGKGGALTIRTGRAVTVGGEPSSASGGPFHLDAGSFTKGGFSTFTVVGEGGVAVIGEIRPTVESFSARGTSGFTSGTRLSDVAGRERVIDLDGRGAPMSLTLSTGSTGYSASSPAVELPAGAAIRMDPGSAVTLRSTDAVIVEGEIESRGGVVSLLTSGQNGVRGVALGSDARILVPGYAKSTIEAGTVVRSIAKGGSVVIAGSDGEGPAKKVSMAAGSVVDASGVSGPADLPTTDGSPADAGRHRQVAVQGDGGAISISAEQGIAAGDLRLGPGPTQGAPLVARGRGGAFLASNTSGRIVVSESESSSDDGPGVLRLLSGTLNGSGADDLTLRTFPVSSGGSFGPESAILFEGNVALAAARSLTFESPVLGTVPGPTETSVRLNSAYVALLGGPSASPRPAGAASLTSDLLVEAGVIDVARTVVLGSVAGPGTAFGGFSVARFHATGDIRLSDHDPAGRDAGRESAYPGLLSAGALEFRAAQVYVASRGHLATLAQIERPDDHPGFLVNSASRVTVEVPEGSTASPVPFSFGERLTLRAPVIEQGGVLRAPAGQIRLEAQGADGNSTGTVTLLPGSVTSVSLAGADGTGLVIPFGTIRSDGTFYGYHQPGQSPGLSVRLDAAKISAEKGSTIDVSGGGDLLGYAFVPGNGGSSDVLGYTSDGKGNLVGAPALGKGLAAPFAVLPGRPDLFTRDPSLARSLGPAPIGPVDGLRDPRLKVGDQVWLQGVPGLAEGIYTLLPARYALLPGGLLVQPMGGSQATAPQAFRRADGAEIVAGYRLVDGERRDPGYGRFAVMTAGVFGAYSQVETASFNAYARRNAEESGAFVRTLNDAGTVALVATEGLALQGNARFGAGPDGRPGSLEVASARIAVVGEREAANYPDHVILDPAALESLGAGSILLGATRSGTQGPSGPESLLKVSASEVVVDTAGAVWRSPEVVLAATGDVKVVSGSVIRAEGAPSGDTRAIRVEGNGALLRVSTGDRVGIARTAGNAGTLSVEDATLAASGSLSFEAGGAVALSPAVDLAASKLDLASTQVHLGDAPADVTGTVIRKALAERLASSSDLAIRGVEAIRLHGDLVLGSRSSGAGTTLVLDTPLLQAEGGASVRIAGAELTLRNSGTTPATGSAASGPGVLELDVGTLSLGPGKLQVSGFEHLAGRAGTTSIRGTGGLSVAGGVGTADRSFETGGIEASSGSRYALVSSAGFFLGRDASASGLAASASLGAHVSVQGTSVLLDTAVAIPAGTFEARATEGSLSLGPHASIDVTGRAVDFEDQVRFAPGGAVRLSASGDLAVQAGAAVDVSGSSRGGDAGTLELSAGGRASLDGSLRGQAVEGARGALFALDAGSLGSFSALNQGLEQGGFADSRQVRLRNAGQDIRLGQGERVSAHDVTLRSDAGRVLLEGAVGLDGDASHAAGGRIEIAGGAGVEVAATASVVARAAEAEAGGYVPASGRVLLASTDGDVSVKGGSIDASGGREGGSIVVRAPRTADGVAVGTLEGQFLATNKVVQGLATSETAAVDATWFSARLAEATSWLAAARARNPRGIGGFDLAPAIVARSGSSLSILGELSLAGPDGAGGATTGGSGYLGLAAKGDIDVGAVVSDGFGGASRSAALLSGRSFGLALEAGGNVLLRRGAMLRTGTGDIAIRAGGDVTIEDGTFAVPAAVIYTAGEKTARADGFGNQGVPSTAVLGEFPTGGGNVDIQAGGSIVAPLATQTTSAWLFRYGDTDWKGSAGNSPVLQQTSWSVVAKNFGQGVGALGGGDVRVRAGGDVTRLQVAIPTTGQLTTPTGQVPGPDDLVVRGGGDLLLSAGNDLRGGLFVLGQGHGDLRAGGDVKADPDAIARIRSSWSAQNTLGDRTVGTLVGLGDATVRITAGGTARIEGAFDPMRQGQVAENLQAQVGTAFIGYGDRTALEVVALGGPVAYLHDPWASVDLSQSARTPTASKVKMTGSAGLNSQFGYAPPTLRLVSLTSDATIESSLATPSELRLESAPRGTLELLAMNNVVLRLDITQEDRAPRFVRNWRAAYATKTSSTGDTSTSVTAVDPGEAYGAVHLGDPEPARLYAIQGSICAQSSSGTCLRQPAPLVSRFTDVIKVSLPKPLHVLAGADILGGYYELVGNGPTDLSVLSAGRDVYQPVVDVLGQGSVVVQAGRDVRMDEPTVQSGTGVAPPLSGGSFISQGNSRDGIVYSALPRDKGANLLVLAGVKTGRVDLDAFTAAYLDPANAEQRAVHDYFLELRKFMKQFDPAAAGLSEADLVAAFRALAHPQRQIFLTGVYFTELRDTGIDYNDPESPRYQSYDRGFHAVATLFPVDPSSLLPEERGNLFLHSKRVETNASAGITLLAPYGRVEVGTDATQERVDYGKGGVVTRRGGDIHVMADQNIDLFSSRVFTLQGGDITMWTSNGSITAGTGSKTSVFQKPLAYAMTKDGVVQVDAFGLQTGAGIGVLDAVGNATDRPRSRLDLIAPRGEVNAGDAGIRVVGDLNIAAAVVVGIENIQVSGASQGVPKVEPPNVAVLTAASQVAQAATEGVVATQAAARGPMPDLPSVITVEVVGYEESAADAEKKKKEKK